MVENFGDQAHASDGWLEDIVVDGYDSGAFLAAMLERMQGKVAEPRGLRVTVYANHAAFLARLIIVVASHSIGNRVFGENELERESGGFR